MTTSSPVRYWRSSVVVAAFLVLIFAALVISSFFYPADARLFPLIICTAGLVLAVSVLVAEIKRRPRDDHDESNVPTFFIEENATARSIALLAAPTYGVLLWFFGFYLASGLTLVLMPYSLGYRRPWPLIVLGAATIVVIKLLFDDVMGAAMPMGLLDGWFVRTFVYGE